MRRATVGVAMLALMLSGCNDDLSQSRLAPGDSAMVVQVKEITNIVATDEAPLVGRDTEPLGVRIGTFVVVVEDDGESKDKNGQPTERVVTVNLKDGEYAGMVVKTLRGFLRPVPPR